MAGRRLHWIHAICFGIGAVVIGMIEYFLVTLGYGYWLELFNGATWPPQFQQPIHGETPGVLFYLILLFRTVLNLGGLLALVAALVWYIVGGLENFLMRNISSIMHIRDAALTGYFISKLHKLDVPISVEIEKALYAAAVEFEATIAGRHFGKEANKAAGASQPAPDK